MCTEMVQSTGYSLFALAASGDECDPITIRVPIINACMQGFLPRASTWKVTELLVVIHW